MRGIIILFGSSLFSGIGWWLGSFIGITTSVILSGIAGGVGIWASRWFIREYLE